MLGPGDFIVIVGVLIGAFVLGVVLVGALHRKELGTGPKAKARRDRIADGALKPHEVSKMHRAENARLKAKGHRPLTRAEMESRLVGDDKFRHRLRVLSRRRHPERARGRLA